MLSLSSGFEEGKEKINHPLYFFFKQTYLIYSITGGAKDCRLLPPSGGFAVMSVYFVWFEFVVAFLCVLFVLQLQQEHPPSLPLTAEVRVCRGLI